MRSPNQWIFNDNENFILAPLSVSPCRVCFGAPFRCILCNRCCRWSLYALGESSRANSAQCVPLPSA